MLKETVTIDSWEHFASIAAQLSRKGPNGPTTFRGQSDSSWALEPSLLRLLREMQIEDIDKALELEHMAFSEFRKHAHLHSDTCARHSPDDLLFWWEMMQHYSAPTRLLDWTHSPYVALYFAVSENSHEDGALYTMDAAHLLWIQSTRRGEPGFENKEAFKHLRASLQREDYEVSMGTISCPVPADRMIAQKGEFTFSTELLEAHDVTADAIVYKGVHGSEGHTIFKKYIIPACLKIEFQARLRDMNISANSLFPGLDGLGRGVQELFWLRNWWEKQ